MLSGRVWRLWAAGLAIAAGTAALMLATEPRLAIVWDEGYTLGREARLRTWFLALEAPERFAATWTPPRQELVQVVPGDVPPPRPGQVDTFGKLLFDRAVVAWFWPFARDEPHGHPPFYALVGLVGDMLVPAWGELPRARLGPMLVFSLTAGLAFVFVSNRWGAWAGSLAAGAWVLQPRLFAHGHYATYDAILSALWIAAIAAFAHAVEPGDRPRWPRWGGVIAFGLIAGCAADTKLTGWLLPIPFAAWTFLYRDRRAFITLVTGGLVAVMVLYALNPPWWTDPVGGVTRFLHSNLGRAKSINIETMFLGTIYTTPRGSLPWYNSLVWTVFVTPVGFLALAIAGVVLALRRGRTAPLGVLLAAHWAFLLLLRSLPHTPGHDGIRQFLPAFGMLALLGGLGAAEVVARFGRWGKIVVIGAIVEAAISVGVMLPVPLSYYSPLVGGLPGATRLGMEPTYYWDALTDEALDWLNAHSAADGTVSFATYPTSWLYLRQTGRLKPALVPPGPRATWYVVQNRPGAFSPLDRRLAARGRPAFTIRKLGVPLLWVFPADEIRTP